MTAAGDVGSVTLLRYRRPFSWEHLLRFLTTRSIAGVERCDAASYTRTLRSGDVAGWLRVEHAAAQHALRLSVSASLASRDDAIRAAVRRMFDVDTDVGVIEDRLGADPVIGTLVRAAPGVRLPGAVDPFELAMRGILGQQVSVAAAHTLCGRVVARYGDRFDAPAGLTHLPVPAASLAAAQPEDIARLGMPLTRARTLVLLARAVSAGDVALAGEPDPHEVVDTLRRIPGIGPWTAEYIAMRALSWADAFPASDLGVRNALGGVTAKQATLVAEAWRPFRAYAVIHLWNGAVRHRTATGA